jgi:helix-turn-helix, Psq domain
MASLPIIASILPKEERIQLAIQSIRANSSLSVRQAATIFDVKRPTLQARIHGRRSAEESQQAQQRLSPQEEQSITRLMTVMSTWGWPMTVEFLERLTVSLLTAKGDTNPLGHTWYLNFLTRHPEFKLNGLEGLINHGMTQQTTLH